MLSLPEHYEEITTHRLGPDFLAEFCTGAISGKSMDVLRASVYSQRRAMLLAVLRLTSTSAAASPFHADLEQAYNLLSAVEKRRPDVVEHVIMHPPTGVWLVRAVRSLLDRDPDPHEVHYLRSLAAAAAVQAGHPCALAVPVIHGAVPLPTLGHVRMPVGALERLVVLRHSGGTTTLYTGDDTEPVHFGGAVVCPQFKPAKYHQVTAGRINLVVEIDDSNPYREFTSYEPPQVLNANELTHLEALFDKAWDELTRRHTGYATELSAGLRTVAPVPPSRGFAGSSSRSAFGSIALSPRTSAITLAEVLVHELQHSKLNALLELVAAHDEAPTTWWYAPWRTDPRPLTGLLHGIYAFASVVEFWHDQRGHIVDTNLIRAADFAFAYRRAQVRKAVDMLASAPGLSEFGAQLVAATSERLVPCEAVTIPAPLAEVVALVNRDHWVTWRLHHIQPDAEYVGRLATAWQGGRRATPCGSADHVVPFHRPSAEAGRITLLRARATDPDGFADLMTKATPADTAFIAGDYETATSMYLSVIRQAPLDIQAWAGLAVSLAQDDPAARTMAAMPETLLAVHNRLMGLSGKSPDPVRLANWLIDAVTA